MFKMEIPRMFDASHQLPDSIDLLTKGCARLHGHTYRVIVRFESKTNLRHGMVVDFKGIKQIVDTLDHQHINDIFELNGFGDYEPTAENIALYLYRKINREYPDLEKLSISVCEGFKGELTASYVTYQQ